MKPWLWLPAEWNHQLAPHALRIYSQFKPCLQNEWRPFEWRHLHFRNPLGIAGGVDKNATQILDWWKLGVGFVEVGTVTPQPQTANLGKILDRSNQQQALWNKMGFPSEGCEVVSRNLTKILQLNVPASSQKNMIQKSTVTSTVQKSTAQNFKRPTPIFINIGKNRSTPNTDSAQDYLYLVQQLHKYADGFVVNVSSPNTRGLRELQSKDSLRTLISSLMNFKKQHCADMPILIKLSPDLSDEDFRQSVESSLQLGIDGFVLTNTTLSRPNGISFPQEGGLSGLPLKNLSIQKLKQLIEILGGSSKEKLIVSVGGISTKQDVEDRLEIGAHLVQVYSALAFHGPAWFRSILQTK